ncbi:MAG: pyridoxamine 5'-phosphate oxidase family protein [Chromatiaceae bacterium]|nr:pyridoxamine 5'-phosphate oxidase family protein [Chromatiaceae bacterium]
MIQHEENATIHAARELLLGRFQGVLATHSVECTGYPFGSLLPFSIDRDGWPLILISDLAKHTRNLIGDPHCSLTVVEAGDGDPQTRCRVSCLADASPVREIGKAEVERHFRYFPESRDYYQELNFRFYRLEPIRFYCVAGFGAARWISVDRMVEKNPFTYEQELVLLEDINLRFADALRQRLTDGSDTTALAVGVDPRGIDLRQGNRLRRLELPAPAESQLNLLNQLGDWLHSPIP